MGGDNYFGILRPHTELVSTNAVDNTDEFVAGTLYDLGAVVKVSAENNLYKCLTKNTTEAPTGNKDTENWLFLGKTNPYKMFDEKYIPTRKEIYLFLISFTINSLLMFIFLATK